MPALARASAPRDIGRGDRRWAEASPTRSGPEGSSRNEICSGSSAGLHRHFSSRSRQFPRLMTDHDLTLDTEPRERDEATSDMFGGRPQPRAPVGRRAGALYRPGPQVPTAELRRPDRPGGHGPDAEERLRHRAHRPRLHAHRGAGVGKTTTARLLARALNYESDSVHQPSVADLAVEGRHCRAIVEGRHLDVLELDAASRTGVDEMRELLDGVRYAPAEARYKVYVIDEVHMLSPRGVQRPAEDPRRAAAARQVHLRHHRNPQGAGDHPVALPALRPAASSRRRSSATWRRSPRRRGRGSRPRP